MAKLTIYVFHSNLNLCSLLVTNQYDCISLSFPSLSDPNKLGYNTFSRLSSDFAMQDLA